MATKKTTKKLKVAPKPEIIAIPALMLEKIGASKGGIEIYNSGGRKEIGDYCSAPKKGRPYAIMLSCNDSPEDWFSKEELVILGNFILQAAAEV